MTRRRMYARPAPDLLEALRSSKKFLRKSRTELPLKEKVRAVIELQRAFLPLLKRRRALRLWESPWKVTPD